MTEKKTATKCKHYEGKICEKKNAECNICIAILTETHCYGILKLLNKLVDKK